MNHSKTRGYWFPENKVLPEKTVISRQIKTLYEIQDGVVLIQSFVCFKLTNSCYVYYTFSNSGSLPDFQRGKGY